MDAQVVALEAAGLDVNLIALKTDDLAQEKAYRLRSAIKVATGLGASPIEHLQDFQPDIVHVHNLFPNWGTNWLNKWDGPLVTTIHNFRPLCAASTLFRDGKTCTACPDSSALQAIVHSCYRNSRPATIPLAVRNRNGINSDPLFARADRVIFLSPRASSIYDRYWQESRKSVVIPNFVDITPDYRHKSHDEWVYIGRLSPEKGIHKLIEHWPEDRILNVYGTGPLATFLAEASNDRVRFHGKLAPQDVASVLTRSKGLVFPSEWAEGLPLVFAEAMGCNIPVVAKSGNSAADCIKTFGGGAVFDTWDQLPHCLDKISTLTGSTAGEPRKIYEREFSPDVWLQRTRAVYEDVLEGGKQ
ncbi:glycosyltransferase family 4 protein [Sinomonas sp. RB5]